MTRNKRKTNEVMNLLLLLATTVSLFAEPLVDAQQTLCGQSSVYIPQGNGSFLAKNGDFPWLVRISIADEPMCTASIINNEWLLSAAKCFLTNKSEPVLPGDLKGHVNEISLYKNDDSELLVSIDRVVINPRHEEISARFNFALLHLTEPLTFSNTVKPICLIDDCIDENAPNSICVISGWASDRLLFNVTKPPFDRLHKSNLPLVDRRACQYALSLKHDVGDIVLSGDMTCAGYEEGYVDDCRGDAGGPLACRSDADNTYYLQGINSFGYGCRLRPGYFHIFARPCYVMPWIRNVTGYGNAEEMPVALSMPQINSEGSNLDERYLNNTKTNSPFMSNNNDIGIDFGNNSTPELQNFIDEARPVVLTATAKKVSRLLLTSDENLENSQCGQNKYGMMAAGKVPRVRPALILEFPWNVRVQVGSFDTITPFTCGATLIEEKWIITSARCITDAKQEGMTTMTAHFGENDLTRPTANEKGVSVLADFIYPGYNNNTYDYDFALLRLSERVRLSDSVRPICLLADCDVKPEDDQPTKCLTIGWNTIANRKSDPAKNPLQVVDVNVTSERACKHDLGENDYSDRKLCVLGAFTGGRPACQVDAGGPLMCKLATEDAYFLHGIASYTQRGCTYKGSYVIYSRPCYVGRWIQNTVRSYDDDNRIKNLRL